MVAATVALSVAGFVLIGVLLYLNSIVVFNSTRYMATSPSTLWCETNYVRMLPNVLKCLYDAGFTAPWPKRSTPFATVFFRRKLHRLLKKTYAHYVPLVQQHLGLWAFIQLHEDNLREVLLHRQIERVTDFLAAARDSAERQTVLTFLNACKQKRQRAARKLKSPLIVMDNVHWLKRLTTLQALLSEHGYAISEDFTMLTWWENVDDQAIVERLAIFGAEKTSPRSFA